MCYDVYRCKFEVDCFICFFVEKYLYEKSCNVDTKIEQKLFYLRHIFISLYL